MAIEIDYLPLWLAKISITPNMIKESNEQKSLLGSEYMTIVDKLVEYQLKAKDILAKEFIENNNIEEQISSYLDLDEDERAIIYFRERKKRKQIEQEKKQLEKVTEELKPKADSFDVFIDAVNYQKMNDVAKALGIGRNKLFAILRDEKILMSDNVPYERFVKSKYFVVKERTILIGNHKENKAQTFVTAKGVDYIRKILDKIKAAS